MKINIQIFLFFFSRTSRLSTYPLDFLILRCNYILFCYQSGLFLSLLYQFLIVSVYFFLVSFNVLLVLDFENVFLAFESIFVLIVNVLIVVVIASTDVVIWWNITWHNSWSVVLRILGLEWLSCDLPRFVLSFVTKSLKRRFFRVCFSYCLIE